MIQSGYMLSFLIRPLLWQTILLHCFCSHCRSANSASDNLWRCPTWNLESHPQSAAAMWSFMQQEPRSQEVFALIFVAIGSWKEQSSNDVKEKTALSNLYRIVRNAALLCASLVSKTIIWNDFFMFFTKFCTLSSPSVLSIGHVISLYMWNLQKF